MTRDPWSRVMRVQEKPMTRVMFTEAMKRQFRWPDRHVLLGYALLGALVAIAVVGGMQAAGAPVDLVVSWKYIVNAGL
jgi:hypothetical protein